MHKAILKALRPRTRCELLKATGGVAVVATSAVAITAVGLPAVAQSSEPDPLEAMEAELLAVRTRAYEIHTQLGRSKLTTKTPFVRWTDHNGKRSALQYQDNIDCIAERLKTVQDGSCKPDSELAHAMDAFVGRLQTKFDRQVAKIQAERDASGFTALWKEADGLLKSADQIEQTLLNTPAQSMRGVAVKLRRAGVEPDFEWTNTVSRLALEDIERLLSSGAA